MLTPAISDNDRFFFYLIFVYVLDDLTCVLLLSVSNETPVSTSRKRSHAGDCPTYVSVFLISSLFILLLFSDKLDASSSLPTTTSRQVLSLLCDDTSIDHLVCMQQRQSEASLLQGSGYRVQCNLW